MPGKGLEQTRNLWKAVKIKNSFEKTKFINAGMLGKGLRSTGNLWKALNITRNIMKEIVLLMRGCLRKD